MRFLILGLAVLASTVAQATTSVSRYLEVDRMLGATADALPAFTAAAARARGCPRIRDGTEAHVSCLLAAMGEVRADGDGRLSTLLLERRGDPFSVAAAVLLLHGTPERLEAVVFGQHVLLALEGDRSRYFDPMDNGREMTLGLSFAIHGLKFSRAERGHVDQYLAYYADHAAVAASSESAFRLALKEAPLSGRIHYDYGAWLLRQSRLDEARVQLGKATRLDPDSVDAWIDRGTVLERLDRLKSARRCFVQVLRLVPGHEAVRSRIRAIDARIAAAVDEQLD